MPTCAYKPKPFNHTSLIPSSLIGIGILLCVKINIPWLLQIPNA